MIHFDTHLGLSDLTEVVARASRALTPHLSEFDSIVTEGLSGLVFAAPLAVRLAKPLVVVRTARDAGGRCFHARDVEGARHAGARTLFADDHIDLGRTLMHVRQQLRIHAPGTRICGTYEAEHDQLIML